MTLSVDDLTFKYRGRRRPALQGVSFELARGETLLVLGPSGCGKSTLARCLNGAVPHFIEGDLRGSVRVGGVDTRQASMAQLAQRVGLVFQDPEAQFCMPTVDEEVAFGLENLAVPRAEMDTRIDQSLHAVGLLQRRGAHIEHLSGGQKQRLALACVLAQRPAVLVLDEPTAQLDPGGAAEVIHVLRDLRSAGQHTLVIVEHRLDEVMPLVDRVLVLGADGIPVALGPPRDVIRAYGAALADAGVWIPQVSELALALGSRGVAVEPLPLTVDEAATALRGVPLGGDDTRPTRDQGAALFEVEHLSYTYAGAASRTLSDVSTTIEAARVTAIVGANGSGKSTLARLLVGILAPPRGTVRFHAARAGYVFQYPEHQFVGRSVLDDVAFGLRRAGLGAPEAARRALAMLERFGLDALAEAHPYTLSHGEQRRLSVAAMLVLEQAALLLDEPTFGQDRRNVDMLLDELASLARAGQAIVAITHDMRTVAERADRVLTLADGELIFDGSPARLFEADEVLRRARLRPPPIWQVGKRLGSRHPPLSISDLVDESFRLVSR
jgi:energy-coupling factor transport system ATP-binding protein